MFNYMHAATTYMFYYILEIDIGIRIYDVWFDIIVVKLLLFF